MNPVQDVSGSGWIAVETQTSRESIRAGARVHIMLCNFKSESTTGKLRS